MMSVMLLIWFSTLVNQKLGGNQEYKRVVYEGFECEDKREEAIKNSPH
jgi:hypothetical protein